MIAVGWLVGSRSSAFFGGVLRMGGCGFARVVILPNGESAHSIVLRGMVRWNGGVEHMLP